MNYKSRQQLRYYFGRLETISLDPSDCLKVAKGYPLLPVSCKAFLILFSEYDTTSLSKTENIPVRNEGSDKCETCIIVIARLEILDGPLMPLSADCSFMGDLVLFFRGQKYPHIRPPSNIRSWSDE